MKEIEFVFITNSTISKRHNSSYSLHELVSFKKTEIKFYQSSRFSVKKVSKAKPDHPGSVAVAQVQNNVFCQLVYTRVPYSVVLMSLGLN